jgi:hypothetical protein
VGRPSIRSSALSVMRAPCCVTGWLTEVTGAEVPGKRSTKPPFWPGRPGPMATPCLGGRQDHRLAVEPGQVQRVVLPDRPFGQDAGALGQ